MIKIFITYFALIALLALPNSPLGPYSNMGLFLLMIMLHLAVRENYLKLGIKLGALEGFRSGFEIGKDATLAMVAKHLDYQTVKRLADIFTKEVEKSSLTKAKE